MKKKENQNIEDSDSSEQSNNDRNEAKRRFKKSKQQLCLLQQNFSQDKNWNREKIINISNQANLTQEKVYKWFWDQKRKNFTEQSDIIKLESDLIVKNGQILKPQIYHFSKINTDLKNEEDANIIMDMIQHLVVLEKS